MAADVLVDTGALVATLDTSDIWHPYCRDILPQLRFPLLTSEAVLTELFHFIGDHRARMESAWKLLHSGTVTLATIGNSELDAIHALMSQYSDLPMDFADATLVYLAQRESIQTILTVDQSDFSVYRIAGRRRFRILPVEHP